jgi:hypothetical protein
MSLSKVMLILPGQPLALPAFFYADIDRDAVIRITAGQ